MINAKEEFIGHTVNKVIKCAYVRFCENDYLSEDGTKFFLTTGFTRDEYNQFLSDIDKNYNNGYGGQELYGVIWYEDGTWTTREEYDGSEWYEYHEVPNIPDYLNCIDKVREKKLNKLIQ
jgi:hypothetical protein